MTRKTLTDKHGDVITIIDGGFTLAPRGHVVVHVKEASSGRVHMAAAYADPADLRAVLDEVAPAGSYTRTESPDYADGGVTAAAIEKETETWRDAGKVGNAPYWRKRAEQAEENVRAREEMINRLAARAEKRHPLTPEDVTRALNAAARSWFESTPPEDEPHDTWKVKQATWVALRDLDLIAEPQRPEGAEEIEADMAAWYGENGMPIGGTGDRLADHLASMGYRKAES